ncbi:MAG: hypothetical protein DRP50_01495 [Thermotoga sp.]|nr:MAG: hypothetical protein DRP50_01495 [Thermotoga sp.]
MKTFLDCIPCFFTQALRTARTVTDDEKVIKRVLDELGTMIKDISLDSSPPETGRVVYHLISEITGERDPYQEVKKNHIDKALSLYDSLKELVKKSNDNLLTAVKFAIVGNIIDLGAVREFDIEGEINGISESEFAISDYVKFKKCLEDADDILYLGDNAGESVFDKILIEEMKKPTKYVVRDAPIINDVTYEDAVRSGIDEVAAIISSGSDAPGVVLDLCSDDFKKTFRDAKFIISKGQGNYEALSEEKYPIFFLLRAKCPVIARDLGVTVGDIVLKGVNIQ